jgi:DNA-binding transcriptional ArsR family regulator
MITIPAARTAARKFAAVGEQTRLRILYTLVDGPRNVTELADAVNVSVVVASHHLTILRGCKLVQPERSGRHAIYALHPDAFTPAAGRDADLLGTLSLGVCKLDLRRSLTPQTDARKGGKKDRG